MIFKYNKDEIVKETNRNYEFMKLSEIIQK